METEESEDNDGIPSRPVEAAVVPLAWVAAVLGLAASAILLAGFLDMR